MAFSAGAAAAQSYTYTDIGDTRATGLYQNIYHNMGINASGTTDYWAMTKTGVTGIYTSNGGSPTTIAAGGSGSGINVGGGGGINDSGLVVFQVFTTASAGSLYVGNGTTSQQVTTAEGYTASSVNFPSIDATGTVAYFQKSAFNDSGIYTSSVSASAPTTVAHSTVDGSRTNPYGQPWISGNGTVAYTAVLNPGNQATLNPSGVYSFTNGVTTTIATAGSSVTNDLDSANTKPVVNNAGVVAFIGTSHSGLQGVYTGSGNGLTQIAVQGAIFSSFSAVAENNNGMVVFSATLPTSQKGIFTGADPLADKIVETGDTLFGSTVTNLFMDTGNLNDAGQVAFIAQLSDGSMMLVRATPAPEPSPTAVLGLGILGLTVLTLRRKNFPFVS